MKLLLIMLLVRLSFASPLQTVARIEREIESDTAQMTVIKKHTDFAIDRALRLAVVELKRRGEFYEAETIEMEWEYIYSKSLFALNRPIGDHKPISQWLAEKYNVIEFVLGVDLCKRLHISDIKSLNHGIPVTIHPCSFPMDNVQGLPIDEYKRHFAGGPFGDDTYFGVVPVISYWAIYGTCVGATAGVGYVILCGLVGEVGERLMGFASPRLSDAVYKKLCGG